MISDLLRYKKRLSPSEDRLIIQTKFISSFGHSYSKTLRYIASVPSTTLETSVKQKPKCRFYFKADKPFPS